MYEIKTLVPLDTVAVLKVYWCPVVSVSKTISSKFLVTNVSNSEYKTVY